MNVIWEVHANDLRIDDPGGYQRRVCAWLTEHGIDPTHTRAVVLAEADDGSREVIAEQYTPDQRGTEIVRAPAKTDPPCYSLRQRVEAGQL